MVSVDTPQEQLWNLHKQQVSINIHLVSIDILGLIRCQLYDHSKANWEKVSKPKVLYPGVTKHLKPPISTKKLDGFHKTIKRIPASFSFEDAYD